MIGTRLTQVVWFVLAISIAWVLFHLASNYGACRLEGNGKIGCLFDAVIVSGIEVIAFAVTTVIKLLRLLLP